MNDQCPTSSAFTWLHLTDLHVGMRDQDWMWPRLKDRLFQDLARLHSNMGQWDMVIFSGDLTQRGSREDFDRLDPILVELWQHFENLGFSPLLIVQPGNHDLAWPAMSSQYRMLKKWWDDVEVRDEFFANSSNEYRLAVSRTFSEYESWVSRFASSHSFLLTGKTGLLAGDYSLEVEKNGIKVGIVSLNSTWLQIDSDDYLGKLHVDIKQLLAVTENEPDAWVKKNDLNLLITHHPTNWLHQSSIELWNSEIYLPGRFDAHLYGHMHEPSAWSAAFGGGAQRISLQGASTCGLRYVRNKLERLHGYSAFQYNVEGQHRVLKAWPRKLHRLGDGSMSFNADVSFPLDENNSYKLQLPQVDQSTDRRSTGNDPVATLSQIPEQPSTSELLADITLQLPTALGHSNIRKVEQQRVIESLVENRMSWIVSEWGMGGDGFLASVMKHYPKFSGAVYRLDLSEYATKIQFFDSILLKLNCSFDRLCQLLAEKNSGVLLLDDAPTDSLASSEVEGIVSVMLEYCPKLDVILRSRLAPVDTKLSIVQLSALDKADLINYISEHEIGDRSYTTADAITRLHTHTDGIPARVDRALKELQVVSISDLVNSDTEVLSGALSSEIPEALAVAIGDLAKSDDATVTRSFGLLKVLSLFPQGESLARVRHFYSTKPFFPAHATELRDQGLIDTVSTQRLDSAGEETSPKILMVPRLAREGVRIFLQEDEVFTLNRRAAELYFGPNWAAGTYKPPPAYRFDKPLCNIADLGNANTIIIRLLRESTASSDFELTERVLGVAVSHLSALSRGSHHQSASTFCDDILSVIDTDRHGEKAALIKYSHARSLRMCGSHGKAKEIIEEIIEFQFSDDKRQSLLLNLALIHEALNEMEDAKRVAKDVVKIDRNSAAGLQARAILIEADTDDPKQQEKLENLETICRRSDAIVAANNIALARARSAGASLAEARKILMPVLSPRAGSDDYYNKSRAIIEIAEQSLAHGVRLTDQELSNLVAVYHFVYNEQFTRLFDRTHRALWKVFATNGDTGNLLSLFRHSSLHWRLRGMEDREKDYLQRLASVIGDTISKRLATLSIEAAYYLVRVSSQLT